MSSVVISGDTSGSITLSAPAVSGTNTATLPAATGTVMVSGNMPAFSAYTASDQSITASTYTKITLDTEEWDTNNNFASSRFTPTVAGYYAVGGYYNFNSSSVTSTRAQLVLYKNGSAYKRLVDISATGVVINGGSVVYMNGSTDYIEFYAWIAGTSPAITGGVQFNNCWGYLTRTA
jgi:hypothetical protein